MKDVEKRVAVLERENADLRARLDALQVLLVPTQPATPRRDEPQVRITAPPLANVALPTAAEFSRLLTIVLDRYPILRPREDPADYAAQFRAAFIRLAHCGRRDKIDNQRGLGFWLDDCQEWCRRHKVNPTWMGGAAFTCAVIAHGDIQFVMGDWPHDFAVGLQFGGGGRESKDWWRRAAAGVLLDPAPPLYPKAAASPARVRQVG
jgi:hypothetical protein